MLTNTYSSYGIITRLLHWTVSIIILTLLGVGFYMTGLPDSPDKFQIYGLHKATGVVLLLIATIRVIWNIINITPTFPEDFPKIQHILHRANIMLLYAMSLVMPISGLLMSLFSNRPVNVFDMFTIQPFAKNSELAGFCAELHNNTAFILITCISLHAGAAIFHHFFKRDRVLLRMIKDV